LIGLVLGSQTEQKPVSGTLARWPFIGAPELSPERIAVAVGVSARYLHDVFQDSGRTVSETLLKLRLVKRHKDLAGPQLARYSNLRLSIDRSDPCVPSNA
jgi:hypothetical protein